jgi:spore coat protein CotH
VTEDIVLNSKWDFDFLELPVLSINTTNGQFPINDKDYLASNVSFLNIAQEYKFNSISSGVRLRGNSTQSFEKKPFRLKFDNKIGFFGKLPAKDWNLIASHQDKTLMRHSLAYKAFARLIPHQFTPSTEFVELYFNNNYLGVYMLTEQMEVNPGRVNIVSETGVLDTGYLIELDWRARFGVEGVDFFYSNNAYAPKDTSFSVDYPKNATYGQVEYIKGFIDDLFEKFLNQDVEAIEQLLDIESFMAYFMIQELFKNTDVGFSSIKMYKEKGGKLVMGPIWDFDTSLGNANYIPSGPEGIWAEDGNFIFSYFMKIPTFRSSFIEYYNGNINDVLNFINSEIWDTYGKYNQSFNRNFEKWQILGSYVWPNPSEVVLLNTIEGQIEYVIDFLTKRNEFLLSYYNSTP